MEVEKLVMGMKAEAPILRVRYHNKLLSMWTRRDGGATHESGGFNRIGSRGCGTGARE